MSKGNTVSERNAIVSNQISAPEDTVSLKNAPDEIKLAIDLIMLLEESQIDPDTILAALKIVMHDVKQRQKTL